MPSGRHLSSSLARYVENGEMVQRILEVGPGTGPVTRVIAKRMGPNDQLDLVELNGSFAECLRKEMDGDGFLHKMADRTRVLEMPVEQLDGEKQYDVIISGLPLNNFPVDSVMQILGAFRELVAPGGTISFFEYVAIRRAKALVSGASTRERLRGISRVLGDFLGQHEIRRDGIWTNVPPAWVHHVRVS